MTITIVGGGNPSGPTYPLQRSVRLRSSASAYFNRTPSVAGNQQRFTWSGWVKLGTISTEMMFLDAGTGNTTDFRMNIASTGVLSVVSYNGAVYTTRVETSAVLRDPSSWYHIVFAIDTTQATASNRVLIYINGVLQTALSQTTYMTQNFSTYINSVVSHTIGRYSWAASAYLDGYLEEINFIDGQQLTPTSFGAYNSYGVWSPAKYTGSYGTNGFYLNFQDNSGATATTIGKDSSGNGNNWTPNNISVTAGVTYDSMLDVPTLTSNTNANYAVLNPLFNTGILGYLPLINGNLTAYESSGSAAWRSRWTTMSMPSGGWYAEFTLTYSGSTPVTNGTIAIGLHDGGSAIYVGQTSTTYSYFSNGTKYNNATSTAFGASYASGDIISVAYDPTNGKVWFGKNGTWQASGDPAAGTNPAFTSVPANLFFGCSAYWNSPDGNATLNANFGQRPFSYTPPTGFNRLNTYNLPAPTIANGAAYMAASLYTGTGAALSVANTVNGVSFQPDFVWVKGRSGATDHALYDSVRGTTKQLESNSTGAETTEATGLTAFGSTGFTVGALAQMNTNTATYVGWQWKANGTPAVTNTSGSIPSTISANTTSGFSIVTYTGTGANATVGHGLGIAPKMVIVKPRTPTSTSDNWEVYHVSTGNGQFLTLNSTAAATTASNRWNNTSPTSTVFSIGTVPSSSADDYVAYCFSEIAGYSKFGSYTGNGSADGPFVYLGFRPRWLLLKLSSNIDPWLVIDSSRQTYNVMGPYLIPNTTGAEATNSFIDFTANGFKIRGTGSSYNTSGGTIIYAAFAESPFNYSLAR